MYIDAPVELRVDIGCQIIQMIRNRVGQPRAADLVDGVGQSPQLFLDVEERLLESPHCIEVDAPSRGREHVEVDPAEFFTERAQ